MRRIIVTLMTTVLFWVALISSASACTIYWYEPEVPEGLRHDE